MIRRSPYLIALILSVLVLLGNVSHAFAQSSTTWLPDFQPGQQIHIDPKLANHRDYPVSFPGLESKLETAGKKHGLKVYFIATEQGSDIAWHHTPAIAALEDLQNRWASNPNLEKENYLIVLWVRRVDNPNKGSVAGVGGNALKALGLKEDYFSDASDGPIRPFLRHYMPQDPGGLVLNVAKEVNGDISSIKFKAMLPYYIGIGILVALVLGTFGYFHVRYSRRKAKAFALILEWRKKFELANPKYIKLKGDYMGMLSERKDWRKKLIGTTRRNYEKALTDFALLTARLMAAGKRLEKAEDDFEDATYLSVKMFDSVIAKLTTVVVKVTDKNIPAEEQSLFGELVPSSEYTPPELLEVLEDLYDEVNTALANIEKAFAGSRKNKRDIEKLLQAIEALKPQLETAGLTFDPYVNDLDEIGKRFAACIEILTADPEEALLKTEALEADTEAFRAELLRAIQIKGALAGVMNRIQEVEARVSELREDDASYAYQLAGDEEAPADSDGATFKLAADNGNPDGILLEAREFHTQASTLVYQGKLDQADKARGDSKAKAEDADDLMDETLEAKEFVETFVTHARNTATNLSREIPAGNKAVGELQANFLPKNIEGYAGKLETAESVRDEHTYQMAEVKRLYDEQDFLRARATLVVHQESIDGSREGIRRTHAWLKTITKNRTDSRLTASRLEELLSDLDVKQDINTFTTSDATDDRLAIARSQVEEFSKETAEDIADWPYLAQATVDVETELHSIDQAIDDEKAAYESAKVAVTNAKKAIASAKSYFTSSYVRKTAKSKRKKAGVKYDAAKQLLREAKSDWISCKSIADAAKALADEAKKFAKADIAAAEDAETAISSANTLINKFARKHYGEGVDADLGSAKRALRSATSSFNEAKYEKAKEYADDAADKANDADDDAEDEVDDIRDKRRRAKAAAAAASSTSTFKIGGSSGGGRSIGGGGGAGGGSYGGSGVGGGNY